MSDLRPDVATGKYDPSLFDPSGKSLLVNEIFYSIQGEGAKAGEATVFVRMAKCNLKCKFCDTEFEVGEKMEVGEIIETIIGILGRGVAAPITFTGGEPGIQNLMQLMNGLATYGLREHRIETSGSVWSSWMAALDWICVSPKVAKHRIPDQLIRRADEFKWIVNDTFLAMYEREPESVVQFGKLNFLQPEWGPNVGKWIAAATKLVKLHPYSYKLSLQTHKYAGNP